MLSKGEVKRFTPKGETLIFSKTKVKRMTFLSETIHFLKNIKNHFFLNN